VIFALIYPGHCPGGEINDAINPWSPEFNNPSLLMSMFT
jgi:hypothetical protein